MFRVARTFQSPGTNAGPQQGFPEIGAGAQTTGEGDRTKRVRTPWVPVRATQGTRSFANPSSGDGRQRGFPDPQGYGQARPPQSMPNRPPVWGGVYQHYTPYYDRGAAAFVPNFGYVLTNPIGAGVVARYRTQASYGPAAQYFNGAIWWTSQVIPTSINLQGLTDPEELAAILDNLQIQAVVRTTG